MAGWLLTGSEVRCRGERRRRWHRVAEAGGHVRDLCGAGRVVRRLISAAGAPRGSWSGRAMARTGRAGWYGLSRNRTPNPSSLATDRHLTQGWGFANTSMDFFINLVSISARLSSVEPNVSKGSVNESLQAQRLRARLEEVGGPWSAGGGAAAAGETEGGGKAWAAIARHVPNTHFEPRCLA